MTLSSLSDQNELATFWQKFMASCCPFSQPSWTIKCSVRIMIYQHRYKCWSNDFSEDDKRLFHGDLDKAQERWLFVIPSVTKSKILIWKRLVDDDPVCWAAYNLISTLGSLSIAYWDFIASARAWLHHPISHYRKSNLPRLLKQHRLHLQPTWTQHQPSK